MKTGFLVVVLTLAVCLSAIGQTSTPPASGAGTSGSPYQLATLNNLYWLSQTSADWDKYYIQTADIDASTTSGWGGGVGFSPIGNATTSFTGSYNGNGKIISGLYINNSTDANIGLFGVLGGVNGITSLGLTSINFSASASGTVRIGGVVGECGGPLSNCYSTGNVSRTGLGLVGGLVGYLYGGTLNKCYSKVNVSASTTGYIGGLVGSLNGYSCTDCYATGNVVAASSTYVGGLIGINGGTVTNCYSSGSVTGPTTDGGLIANNNSGTVNNSFWDNQTSGQSSSAGGGTGKTTAEMKTQSTFTSWNFSTIWEMIGTNYPRLISIPDGALPVELTSITAIASANTAAIQWQTATEVNNYGFEIQRRGILNVQQGMSNWEKVGFLVGSGTSSSPREYSFVDRNLALGRYAYRIKQIDHDGTFKYHGNAEVEIGLAEKQFVLESNYPNPFNPSTTIRFTLAEDAKTKLRVFNVLGEEVATLFDGVAQAGRLHEVTFDASSLPSGVYFSTLESGNQRVVKKMVLMK